MEKSSRIFLALGIATIVTVIAGAGVVVQTMNYTPSFKKLTTSARVAKWSQGVQIGYREVGPQTADWVGLDAISNHLIGAVIASEDTSFFGHSGVDFHELKQAIKKDFKEKRWARGASTITQQVVKNVYLTHEKTLWRKFREILWAWELDKAVPKSDILCFYLNMAHWGPDIYGIRQAARHYFNSEPSDLLAHESAFLAMLLPSPEKYYAYFKNKELSEYAHKRIEKILKIMNKMGSLSNEEYVQALGESLWGETTEVIVTEPSEPETFPEPFEETPQEPSPDATDLDGVRLNEPHLQP